MKKVLIFPAPFLIKAPTVDQQNEYMISSLKDEMSMEGIGDFVEVNALNKSDYGKEVRKIIAERKPNWVIASGESATACIGLHGQKKILVNPIVTFDDLNNVTYLYFDTQTTKMSMWYSWSRFKKEIANSNMLIHFDKNKIDAFEKSDDSNMIFIEASVPKTSKERTQELANMLLSQIQEVRFCKSQNLEMLILVQIPLDADFTYKELKNIKEFVSTNFPADAIIPKVQMGVAEREDDNIKIICVFNSIG